MNYNKFENAHAELRGIINHLRDYELSESEEKHRGAYRTLSPNRRTTPESTISDLANFIEPGCVTQASAIGFSASRARISWLIEDYLCSPYSNSSRPLKRYPGRPFPHLNF